MSSAFVLGGMSFRKFKPVLLNSIQRGADIPIFIILFHCYICKFRSECYCTCYHVYRLGYYFPR